MSMAFLHPWVLTAAVIALLPWLRHGQRDLIYSSTAMLPEDRFSLLADRWLRAFASLAILAMVTALAGPFLREQQVERIGTGAEIILLIDRSSSMNENFSGRYLGGAARESKGAVARRLLTEFVAGRDEDRFALVTFSAAPIYVLPLTQDHTAVLAAIRSSADRGHGITNIGSALVMALDFFEGRPVTGSRCVVLVSDGAARIDEATRSQIQQRVVDTQARLYWIYLRNRYAVRLDEKPENPSESTTPEYFLHEFFRTLGTPYRAYEADSPEAVRQAIAEIGQAEDQPLEYFETVPRLDLSGYCHTFALVFLLPLIVSRVLEVESWSR